MALTPEQLETLKKIKAKQDLAVSSSTQPEAVSTATPPAATTPQPSNPSFLDKVGQFGAGVISGFSAPGRTIKNNVLNPLGRAVGLSDSYTTDAEAYGSKGGNLTGEIATFIAPGSMATSAARGLPVLARAGIQGATSFAQQSLNQGKVDQSSVAAGLTDAAFPIAGKVLGIGGDILKGLAGGAAGTGVDVIDAAFKSPGAAFKAAGDGSTDALRAISEKARAGVVSLSKKASEEYGQLVSKAGVKEVPRDFVVNGMKQRLAELADATVTKTGIEFVDTPFTEAEEKLLTKVVNNIQNWQDFTPEGLNTLARKISRFRRGVQDSANFDRVVDTVKRDLREFVGEIAPTIKEANSRFAEKMDLIDELDNVLKTDTKYAGREGIRKTAESLSRIFNGGKEFSREAVQELEKELGIDILGTVAGQQLSQTGARSTAAIGDVFSNIIRPFGSVAARNLVPAAGAIKTQLIDRIDRIPGISPTTRAAIVASMAEFFEDDSTQPQE